MSEFRQDRTTGRWSIIAPERGARPGRPELPRPMAQRGMAHDPACPFCPGNEAMLPQIVDAISCDHAAGWIARAVPNKFPVVTPQDPLPGNLLQTGHGIHEVIIETPRHDADLDELSASEVRAVIEMWHRRYLDAVAQPGIACVCLFRNRGKSAGASQTHAHSQLIAVPFVPPRLAAALDWAEARFADSRICPTCDEVKRETAAGERIVDECEHFAALVPYTATGPLEQWIVPRTHTADFGMASGEALDALAAHLQRGIARLRSVAGDIAYKVTVDPGSRSAGHSPYAHWSLRILPEMITPGGFESLSGLAVNPSSPERDTQRLREA